VSEGELALFEAACCRFSVRLAGTLGKMGIHAVPLYPPASKGATAKRKDALRSVEDGKVRILRGNYSGSIVSFDPGVGGGGLWGGGGGGGGLGGGGGWGGGGAKTGGTALSAWAGLGGGRGRGAREHQAVTQWAGLPLLPPHAADDSESGPDRHVDATACRSSAPPWERMSWPS
jgi:hypothetical protein